LAGCEVSRLLGKERLKFGSGAQSSDKEEEDELGVRLEEDAVALP
jgi:hypothetical protein